MNQVSATCCEPTKRLAFDDGRMNYFHLIHLWEKHLKNPRVVEIIETGVRQGRYPRGDLVAIWESEKEIQALFRYFPTTTNQGGVCHG